MISTSVNVVLEAVCPLAYMEGNNDIISHRLSSRARSPHEVAVHRSRSESDPSVFVCVVFRSELS